MRGLILLVCLSAAVVCTPLWSTDKAQQWYYSQQWGAGINFIPSTADNELEMWQADTFDTKTIERELTYAQLTGFSLLRVFLHIRAYLDDPSGFLDRMFTFLSIAAKHGHKTLFVLFDDCWREAYESGKQPQPIPGIHNSQWLQCPGTMKYTDAEFKAYTQEILKTFGSDARVIMWDLYNEVGNSGHLNNSYPLMKKVFDWAREINITQPITSGHWNGGTEYSSINQYILSNSDINTFHAYCDVNCTEKAINAIKGKEQENVAYGRPTVCTEYMARDMGSKFITHLPLFKQEKVWAISWGLVFGRTQTYYPWWSKPGDPVPKVWFHDVFHPNGTSFDTAETDFIRQITLGSGLKRALKIPLPYPLNVTRTK